MSPRSPAPPPDLPGFDFVELLGSGGFADVFKYTQLGLGRQVAVKVLTSGVGEADLAAFGSEANVMAQLSNHPSIVSIYQAGVTPDGRPFLVMEFCPPPHLGLRIRQRPLGVAKALEITIQLAGAIETAHRLGILHRDIKPANILFTEFGRPALTDFGISVTTQSGASGEGVGMSVPWAPPEQLTAGSPMGPTADVYSLAATLWTVLVGRSPFHVPGAPNEPHAMAPRVRQQPLPPTRRPEVPDSLERVLRTAMAKAPEGRYASAVDLARALQGVQAELHQAVTPLEVRDEQLRTDGLEEEGQGGTRVTGFIAIDPEVRAPAPAPAPVRAPDPVSFEVADQTVVPIAGSPVADTVTPDVLERGADVAGVAPEPGSEPVGRLRRGLLVVGALVVTGVVAAVLLQGGSHGDPGTDAKKEDPGSGSDPGDPIADKAPAPTGVTVTKVGTDKVRVTWKNPEPRVGDHFTVWINAPGAPRMQTTATRTEIATMPGSACVNVILSRLDGPSSDPGYGCPQ